MTDIDIKAAVRDRDGYRCTKCGMTAAEHRERYRGRTLDVHRLSPGSEYTVEGCVTLCRKCHGPEPKQKSGTTGRVSFDADDEVVRRAIYIAAAMTGKSHNDVLNDIVRQCLGEYMALAKRAIERDEPAPRRKKGDAQ